MRSDHEDLAAQQAVGAAADEHANDQGGYVPPPSRREICCVCTEGRHFLKRSKVEASKEALNRR
jgi:hypothetical protein